MSNYTENYNLKKPTSDDFYNVEDSNGNMDIIDAEIKKLNENKAEKTLASQTADGLMGKDDKSKLDKLATVATSGSYNDLTNRPTLGTAASKNTGLSSGSIPTIGPDGKLDSSIMPALAITDTFVVNSQAAMLALTAQVGDVCVRSDLSKSFILKAEPATTLANWQELLSPPNAVISVNGKTGAVTLSASDVGAETPTGAQSKVDTHANRKDNPHGVTTNQVNVISFKDVSVKPIDYPIGITIFDAGAAGTLNYPFQYGVVVTHKINENRTSQWIYEKSGQQRAQYRTGDSSLTTGWTDWLEVETTSGSQKKADAVQENLNAHNAEKAKDDVHGFKSYINSFGIGDVAKDISNTDLNNLDATGFYRGSKLTNAPTVSSGVWFYVIHLKHAVTYQHQMVFSLDVSQSSVYTRIKNNGVWSAWTQLATQDWLKGFGIGGISPNVSDANAVTETGFYTVTGTLANFPGSNGGTLIHSKRDGARPTQIFIDYLSNIMYFRSYQSTGWTAWNTVSIEQTSFQIYKSGKDANGIFTQVDYKRKADGKLAQRSVLSGGTSPNYTTETVNYYGPDGTTVVKTETFTLSYDSDGDLISRV